MNYFLCAASYFSLVLTVYNSSVCLISLQEYKEEFDPAIFKSVKTGRGPLGPNWKVLHLFLRCDPTH